MTLEEVLSIIDGKAVSGDVDLQMKIQMACGADLMSDVLAFVKDQPILLTGLVNTQVVRTADMMDINCVVFVRGKKPDPALVELARERGMAVMSTPYTMYSACGRLYSAGLVV